MLVTKVLAAALAVFSGAVMAAPGSSDSGAVLLRDGRHDVCRPGMSYVGWKHKCKCDDDDHWYSDDEDDDCYDKDKKRCHPKSHPKYHCRRGEKQYCAKSKHKWCEHDEHNEFCYNDGSTKTFCCKPRDLDKKLKKEFPSHKECRKGQHWDHHQKKCVCPKNKEWDEHKKECRWKPMKKPDCHGKKKAYCAKNDKKFTEYDPRHPYCADNGHHITFCCSPKPGKPEKKCKDRWDGKGDEDSDSESEKDD